MRILGLQETDWLNRGPNTQHHLLERLSKNSKMKITVIDYDINKLQRSNSFFIKKRVFSHIERAVRNSDVKVIRTAHIQIPYVRRISSLITNFFEIFRIIRKEKPDMIIGFSMTNGIIGLFFSKIFHIPYIFYYIDLLHTLVPISYVKKLARIISRFLFKFSDQLIVVTTLLYDFVLKEGAASNKVKILLNGISLENTEVDEKKLKLIKTKHDVSENDFVLFFMGYLYDFAGLKEIIDFYNDDVKNGKYNIKLLIVGDGGIYKELIKHIREIKADWVILTGRIPFFEIPEYINLADLCLMSFKLNEITKTITPVKVLEYMAMKKPVLSNSLPGIILEIGKNKGVIFVNNQQDLIKKIATLIPQKEELRKIGLKGYSIIEERYIWSKIIKEFKTLMIKVIKNKRMCG